MEKILHDNYSYVMNPKDKELWMSIFKKAESYCAYRKSSLFDNVFERYGGLGLIDEFIPCTSDQLTLYLLTLWDNELAHSHFIDVVGMKLLPDMEPTKDEDALLCSFIGTQEDLIDWYLYDKMEYGDCDAY